MRLLAAARARERALVVVVEVVGQASDLWPETGHVPQAHADYPRIRIGHRQFVVRPQTFMFSSRRI